MVVGQQFAPMAHILFQCQHSPIDLDYWMILELMSLSNSTALILVESYLNDQLAKHSNVVLV